MRHLPIDDPRCHTLHQPGVRNRVKVLRQIRVHDIRISRSQQFIHFLNRILRTLPRTVAIGIRLQVRLIVQVLPQAVQPLLQPARLDIREVYLVVELIKAESRLLLRLALQLDLQVPNFIRRCQAHRQSPLLSFFASSPEVRVLAPPTLSDARWSVVLSGHVHRPRPCDHPGPPLLTADYLPGMLCSLPRWPHPCRWLSV